MKFKITITKEVIDKSAWCGGPSKPSYLNCAFAVAYNQLIPKVAVLRTEAVFLTREATDMTGIVYSDENTVARIKLPANQTDFIGEFDELQPQARYSLVGREFEVEIPDSVIEYWHGDVVKAAQSIIDNPILKPLQLV